MTIQKISLPELATATAFVATDLDNAERYTGVVRSAKKILQDGAKLLARSQTYSWAVLGQQVSGASAGINLASEDRSAAIAGFCEQILPRFVAGELSLDAGKGVGAGEISPLIAADPVLARRHEEFMGTTLGAVLLAAGVATAAGQAIGGLDGRTVVIEGSGDATAPLVKFISEQGGRVVALANPDGSGSMVDMPTDLDEALAVAAGTAEGQVNPGDAFSIESDVLICGSKSGLIDHEVAARLVQSAIIPIGATPITARGLAVAHRREVKVLADFVSTSGPLFVELSPTADPAALVATATERVGSLCAEFAEHPDGDLLGACYRAEEYLKTWREELPFGRPIA
ncbi:MAG TPA: hypothetical protein VL068_13720 [Microthrixaceae bacterium]|nr:hypothetical protein [Microthrixaceae bacterium]